MVELAASFLIGFLVVALISSFLIFREMRFQTSLPIRQIQDNLAQVGKRFSHSRDALVPIAEAGSSSQLRSFVLLAVGCAFLSWVGLVFFILIWVSLAKLGHRERDRLLNSDLSQSRLETSHIQEILSALENSRVI